MTAVWDIAPCSVVEAGRRFIATMIEAVHISETSVYFETSRHCIREGGLPYSRCRENMKSNVKPVRLLDDLRLVTSCDFISFSSLPFKAGVNSMYHL
jgi:hypothetical protein